MKQNLDKAKEKIRTKEAPKESVDQMVSENAASNLAKNRRLSRVFLQTTLKTDLPEDLDEALLDGVILCKLMEVGFDIKPKKIYTGKIKAKWTPNVKQFLEACAQVNVPNNYLFQPNDLIEKKDMKKVYECILALQRLYKPKSDNKNQDLAQQQNEQPKNTQQQAEPIQQQQKGKDLKSDQEQQQKKKPELSDIPLESQEAQQKAGPNFTEDAVKQHQADHQRSQKQHAPTPASMKSDSPQQFKEQQQKSPEEKTQKSQLQKKENVKKEQVSQKKTEDVSKNQIEPKPFITPPMPEVNEVEPVQKTEAKVVFHDPEPNKRDFKSQQDVKDEETEPEQDSSTEQSSPRTEQPQFDYNFVWETDNEVHGPVYVVGSFSGWEHASEMEKQPLEETDGKFRNVYSVTIPLHPGEYQYKFLIDQEWKHSPKQPIVVDGSFVNNYVQVLTPEQQKSRKSVPFVWVESGPMWLDDIFVCGSFSNWWVKYPLVNLSENEGERTYWTEISIEPGEYEFKFIRNGEWVLSPQIQEANGDQGPNHKINVE
jgi:chemotaxis protein histidine kinase CheA